MPDPELGQRRAPRPAPQIAGQRLAGPGSSCPNAAAAAVITVHAKGALRPSVLELGLVLGRLQAGLGLVRAPVVLDRAAPARRATGRGQRRPAHAADRALDQHLARPGHPVAGRAPARPAAPASAPAAAMPPSCNSSATNVVNPREQGRLAAAPQQLGCQPPTDPGAQRTLAAEPLAGEPLQSVSNRLARLICTLISGTLALALLARASRGARDNAPLDLRYESLLGPGCRSPPCSSSTRWRPPATARSS